MNDQIIQLIESLADKLGTTSEYIWKVLIEQAPITAITEILFIFFVIAGSIILYFLHRKFSKKPDENGDEIYTLYEKYDDFLAGVMIALTVLFIILLIVSAFLIENIINAFFHPEYWALQEILKSLK